MYADNSLTPKEAARLCALGTLSDGEMAYGELAASVRHFIDRIQGPTLDVMGSSVELLKYEGLIAAQSGEGEMEMLMITHEGHLELKNLLIAHVRPGATDLNKLIIALKFRFMNILELDHQRSQVGILIDTTETELLRLTDLRQSHLSDKGHIVHWIEFEIKALSERIEWLEWFKDKLT